MRKMRFLSLAVAAVLCAGFVSCGDDDDDEPQKPATENTGGASDSGGNSEDAGEDNGGDENGDTKADAVDLGLPSGTLWASWNVGATAPEEYGGYYAWGETEKKETYTEENYKHYDHTWQEYINIGDDISGTMYDVAHVMWGDGWHIPTMAQIWELIHECTWEWISYKGTVSGYKVTGTNGNHIFLPAAGYCNGFSIYHAGRFVSYWSSILLGGGSQGQGAYGLYIGHIYFQNESAYGYRYDGRSVRPVKEK